MLSEDIGHVFRRKSALVLDNAATRPIVVLVKIMGPVAPRSTKDRTLHGIRNRDQSTVQICKQHSLLKQLLKCALRPALKDTFQIGVGKAVNIDVYKFLFLHIRYHPNIVSLRGSCSPVGGMLRSQIAHRFLPGAVPPRIPDSVFLPTVWR